MTPDKNLFGMPETEITNEDCPEIHSIRYPGWSSEKKKVRTQLKESHDHCAQKKEVDRPKPDGSQTIRQTTDSTRDNPRRDIGEEKRKGGEKKQPEHIILGRSSQIKIVVHRSKDDPVHRGNQELYNDKKSC